VSAEADLVQVLSQLFPAFRALPAGEPERRTEALGLYAAQVWAAGPEGLRARGVPIPPQVHGPLAPIAPRVLSARQGGATFLAQVRRGLGDPTFAQAVTALARLYADSLRGAPAPAQPSSAPAQPAAAAPAGLRATREQPSFEALIGGGLADGPPIVAPPPRPAQAAPSRPQPSSAAAPALAPAPAAKPAPSWGDLDLMPEDAPAIAPAPAPKPAAPAPKAAAPPKDYGGLDLLPEEPEPEDTGPPVEVFDPGADEDAKKPAARGAPGARSGGSAMAAAVAAASAGGPGDDSSPLEPEPPPSDPVMAALRRFERQGDASALAQAEQLLKAEFGQAPHAIAAAAAMAGMARVELLRGRAAQAEKLAKDALAKDPSTPLAVEVLVRLERGEADLSLLMGGITALREVLDARDAQRIRTVADRFRKQFPDEPHAYLAMFMLGKLTGDERLLESGLREAWKRFPSPRAATTAFGGAVDADLVDLLVHYGRECFKDKDDARLKKTVEGVDDKENIIAGSLRMGVAMARVALARPGITRGPARRLTYAIGRGLVGLQYYDAAMPYFGKASCMGPTPEDAKAMGNERIEAGALRRAFDRPGIKAQLKAYSCLGIQSMSDNLRQRLEAIRKARGEKEQEGFARGTELAAKARADTALKAELVAAAQAAGVSDAFATIDAAEAELAQVQRERQQAKDPAPAAPGGGGLFGKLKAAASTVTGAAKDGLLALKESQATTKRDEAAKHLGVILARELSDVQWKHPVLKQLARELSTIEAFLDYFQTEESKAKAELGRLAESV
jgi:hypothetical protein